MHGSEILAKDVLEYVIFENNISNQYGVWRLHAKIIPDWTPPREPSRKTYRVVEETTDENNNDESTSQEDAVESVQTSPEGQPPSLATA